MICASCGEAKAELHAKRSQLFNSMKILLCNSCTESKYEPRYLVIMYARSRGVDAILSKVINQRRYVGKTIEATDVIV